MAKNHPPSFKVEIAKQLVLAKALGWFSETLLKWTGRSYYIHDAWMDSGLEALLPRMGVTSDASFMGAAILTKDCFSYWVWCPCCVQRVNAQKPDIAAFELLAVAAGWHSEIGQRYIRKRVTHYTNNAENVNAFNKGFGSGLNANLKTDLIAEIRVKAVERSCMFRMAWVSHDKVKRTDSLTRGKAAEFMAGDSRAFVQPAASATLVVLWGRQGDEPAMMGIRRYHPAS